jgi:putative (di)nucleoside polyphosphate hydrolase
MPSKAPITCGIYLYDKTSQKILICHATNASWKTWSIPKGLKDEGEDELDAAIRELQEETGIQKNELDLNSLVRLEPVKYKKQNKFLQPFFVLTAFSLMNKKLVCSTMVRENVPEIDKWAWVEPEEILKKLHESQQHHYSAIFKLIKDNS